jgi:hypothetical protein
MCHLQKLYAKYSDKGLVVLGFNASDDKNIALEMMRDNKVTFPNIIDSSDAAHKVCFNEYQRYGRSAVPMSYVIGRDGKILAGWYGYDGDEPQAMAAFEKAGGELAEAIAQEKKAEVDKESAPVLDDAMQAMEAGGKAGSEAPKGNAQPAKPITAESAKAVAAAARRLFDAIQDAEYDRDWAVNDGWKHFPDKDAPYRPERDHLGWVRWVCKTFKANAIGDVRLGRVVAGSDGSPSVYYELHLKNGKTLKGDLPFHWDAKKKQWIGMKALDWHLEKKP